MRYFVRGISGLCLILAASACGGEKCLDCTDCPDFRGVYQVYQEPLNELCEAYYLATGTFYYEVIEQDGNDLVIEFIGGNDEIYYGSICGTEDDKRPYSYSFCGSYSTMAESGESVTINLSGAFIEPYAGAPAQLQATINVLTSHVNDSRYNCSMMGDSSGFRLE